MHFVWPRHVELQPTFKNEDVLNSKPKFQPLLKIKRSGTILPTISVGTY